MILPTFKRILKTDYAQQFQSMIETLSYSLNNAIEQLNTLSTNNVSLSDNILCTVKTISVAVDMNGKPTANTVFPLSFSGPCKGLSVINTINSTNSTGFPVSGVTISFAQTQTGIQVNNITGLQPNNTYNITVIAWG